jgi:hypothetical protein
MHTTGFGDEWIDGSVALTRRGKKRLPLAYSRGARKRTARMGKFKHVPGYSAPLTDVWGTYETAQV